MTFGETLANLRKTKGLSQEQLAAELGLTRQTISKWELNQSSPDIHYLVQLSNYFAVSTDCLIKGEAYDVGSQPSILNSQAEAPVSAEPVSKGVNVYKLCVYLGSILSGVSLLGIIVFVVCSALHPWGALIGNWHFEGLPGFLIGTGTLWFFVILLVFFIAGLIASVYGILKLKSDASK